MKDHSTWSFPLGKVLGVPLRIHVLVMLFSVACLALIWQWSDLAPGLSATHLCAAISTGWLIAVFAHELGRLVMAWQVGCDVRGMLLMPWGAVLDLPPLRGLSRIGVYLAGPFANVATALAGAVLCFGLFDTELPLSFFNPLEPQNVLEAGSVVENAIRVAIWMNIFLAIVNLAPVALFDGGQIVVGLIQLALPNDSARFQQAWVTLIGQVVAIGLIVVSLIVGWPNSGQPLGIWFFLLLSGITMFFAARLPWEAPSSNNQGVRIATNVSSVSQSKFAFHDDHESVSNDDLGDYEDVSHDVFNDEPLSWHEEPSNDEETLSTWLKERQTERVEQARIKEREDEVADERQADAILEKVHTGGLESLTPDERAVLDRVSARYRRRSREEA